MDTSVPVHTTSPTTRRHPLSRATVISGVTAAVAATVLAAVADAAGVPLQVDGETIPLLGFTQLTLVGALIGGLMAAGFRRFTDRSRTWFVATAVALTALSCIPSVTLPPDGATRAVLIATHLVAAAVVVPVLARHLRGQGSSGRG
jgi:peptidoglycan/LPS O-acetylase OafA/YrhL